MCHQTVRIRPVHSLPVVAVALNTSPTVAIAPAVIHFGGYRVNQTHKQTLRVYNISGDRVRFAYSDPTTSWFKIKPNKKVLTLNEWG
jgi:hypothetical protein